MLKIAIIYFELIPSVRLCVYEQLNWLQINGVIEFKAVTTFEVTDELCKEYDCFFFVRSSTPLELLLCNRLKSQGKWIGYIIDDDLLNVPRYSESYAYLSEKSVSNRIRKMVMMSNALIAPSLELLKQYVRLNPNIIKIDEPCLKRDCSLKTIDNRQIKIGFAGSFDRTYDMDILMENIIKKLIMTYGDKIKIEFVGIKPKFAESFSITCFPYQNQYEDYQKLMAQRQWDIGLAPLFDSPFNRCKYFNKYIEYGSFNIVGIYSNVHPYTEAIQSGVNGILVNNTESEWIQAIEFLVNNQEVLLKCKKNIADEMETKFNISIIARQFMNRVINQITVNKRNNESIQMPIKLIKLLDTAIRSYEYIRRNKDEVFSAVIKKINSYKNK